MTTAVIVLLGGWLGVGFHRVVKERPFSRVDDAVIGALGSVFANSLFESPSLGFFGITALCIASVAGAAALFLVTQLLANEAGHTNKKQRSEAPGIAERRVGDHTKMPLLVEEHQPV